MTNETGTQDQSAHGYPLANDADGYPLAVPPEAVAWRVRKLARRAGRPKVLFNHETGRPLEFPIGVSYDDFIEQVGEFGRFRLEAIDANGQPIGGCVAVTEIAPDEEQAAALSTSGPADQNLIQLVAQLVESNTRVMQAMAARFGNVPPNPAPMLVEHPAMPARTSGDSDLVLQILTGLGVMPNASVPTPPRAATPGAES